VKLLCLSCFHVKEVVRPMMYCQECTDAMMASLNGIVENIRKDRAAMDEQKELKMQPGEQARIEDDEDVRISAGEKWGILITLSDYYDLARLSLHSSGRFLFVESSLLNSGSECIELGDDLAINLYGFTSVVLKDLQTENDGLKEELERVQDALARQRHVHDTDLMELGKRSQDVRKLNAELDNARHERNQQSELLKVANDALAKTVGERDDLQDKLKIKSERLQYEVERADFNYGVGEEYKAQLNEAKEELRHCQILLDSARSDATSYKVDAERQEVEVAKLEAVKKALMQLIHEMR